MNYRKIAADITDAAERRHIPYDRIELRDDSEDPNIVHFEGYASTFQDYEMYGGPEAGGWIERMGLSCFDKTLREKPDLHFLINHAGMPIARTKSGTMQLSVDEHGLKVVAQLDKRDPDVQGLAIKMARGDMDEMSFAFRVKQQTWEATPEFKDDPQALRTITELSLHKGDVSMVNWGANPTTHAEVKSAADALRYLAECDESELVEARAVADVDWTRVMRAIPTGTAVNVDNLGISKGLSAQVGAQIAERNIAYAGQVAGAGVSAVMAEALTRINEVRMPEGDSAEMVDTLRWLHAELSWRADVREWLDAEIREWLSAEEVFPKADIDNQLSAKTVGTRYARALLDMIEA